MKQLLYTSCEAGKSLDGAGGFQVRAASAGIGPERMRAAVRYMAYGLPDCIHPSQMAPSSSPVRLAFLKTPELGPILCHSVSAGLDPTTRRPGNFFSHVLLDVPPAFTVAAAINTWESDSWRRADGPFEATLQDIEGIRATGSLTDEALGQFALSEHGRKMFSFVLAALLTREPDCRIFLAASSQDVAFCVYGLTRVLPQACLGALTFSTYESQPLSCPARLVGTWAADSAEVDMPSSCYFGKAVGYNSHTGRASQVVAEGDFLEHAMTVVVTGDRKGLDQLLAVCDQCGIDRPEMLNLVCHAECGGELAKNDLLRLAIYPRFLSHLLGKLSVQQPLLDRFAEDRELTGVLAVQVVPVLKESPEAIAAFRESAKQTTIEAILHGNLSKTQTLLEHILPAASDAPTALANMTLLGEIGDPNTVPWQTRAYLLTQMAGIPSNGLQSALLAKWLSPPPAELPSLCGLPIPEGWKSHACLTCLQHTGVTGALVDTLASHPELLLNVLHNLPGDKDTARNLPSLVSALLARSRAPAGLVGDLLRRREQMRPEVTSAFVAAAARSGSIDVLRLASQCGPALLEVLNGGSDLDTFLARLLDCSPEKLLSDSQILALFQAAARKKAPGEIRDGLESVMALRSFLDRPILREKSLARVAVGLGTFRGTAIETLVLQAALGALIAERDSPNVGIKVESLLRNFGTFTPGGPCGLYRWLLGQFRNKQDFWTRQHLICAMVAIGLGATEYAELSRHVTVMAEQARDLAEEVAKRSKRRVFTFIDRQSRDWQDEARVRWDLFAKFVRPRSLFNRISGTWKTTVGVPMVLLCLIVGANRMSCRGGTVGTGFASSASPVSQSPTTKDPLAKGIGHDRPQP